jgi:surfeit locus 1 family protein
VLRALRQPRFAALAVAALLLAAGFVLLGRWQWQVAHPPPPPRAQLVEPVAPLTEVIDPRTPVPVDLVGRRVSVSGRFLADEQLTVPGRTSTGLADTPTGGGAWVLTPLLTADHLVVPVVRGWVADPSRPPAPPSGPVTVSGRLFAAESDDLRSSAAPPLPDGQVAVIAGADLVTLWRGDIVDGFVAATDVQPPGTAAALPAVSPPLPSASATIRLRNAAYAVQWWCFAGLLLFFVARVIRDESRRNDEATPTPTKPTVATG